MNLFLVGLSIAVFFFSWILTGFLRKYAINRSLIDEPGRRSSHELPTPRGGGISFVLVWLMLLLFFRFGQAQIPEFITLLIIGSVAVSLIGIFDDHFHLKATTRFVVHISASIFTVWFMAGFPTITVNGAPMEIGLFGYFIAVLAVSWSINLFNFLDGIDTYASMESIMVLLASGALFFLSGADELAVLAFTLSAGVAGFLLWNLPPAKIFMGDGASGFLGYVIAVFAIIGERVYQIPVALWIIMYSTFWVDATITLLRRIIKREKWFSAHNKHAYQRLYQSGWSHGKVSIYGSFLNLVLILLAFTGYFQESLQMAMLLIAVSIAVAAYFAVERIKPMHDQEEA